jgi:hypothetical protein
MSETPKLPAALEKIIGVVLAHKPKAATAKVAKKRKKAEKSAKAVRDKAS